ncbi:MAG TPA: hypothetical protein VN796_06250 [Acidimicrobiales bacterium]|nr:hypothetical protein [Acidimicrobiales bacterium]
MKTRVLRMVASVALVGSGIGGSVLAISGSAHAVTPPVTAPTKISVSPDIVPNSQASQCLVQPCGVTADAATKVSWKHLAAAASLGTSPNSGTYTRAAGFGMVVTECNAGVLVGDAAACNSTITDLDTPGGPYLYGHHLNRAGTGNMTVRVMEGTVGDGVCSDLSVCYLSLTEVNLNTDSPTWVELLPIAFDASS